MVRKGNSKEGQTIKKQKDPNAPKRPQGPFSRFSASVREEVKKGNPGAFVGQIGKIIAGLWNELPESKKLPFQFETEREMRPYRETLNDYNASKAQEPVRAPQSYVPSSPLKGKIQKTD